MQIVKLEIQEEIYPIVYKFLKLISPKLIKIKKINEEDEILNKEYIEDYNRAVKEIKKGETTKLTDYIKKRGINVWGYNIKKSRKFFRYPK